MLAPSSKLLSLLFLIVQVSAFAPPSHVVKPIPKWTGRTTLASAMSNYIRQGGCDYREQDRFVWDGLKSLQADQLHNQLWFLRDYNGFKLDRAFFDGLLGELSTSSDWRKAFALLIAMRCHLGSLTDSDRSAITAVCVRAVDAMRSEGNRKGKRKRHIQRKRHTKETRDILLALRGYEVKPAKAIFDFAIQALSKSDDCDTAELVLQEMTRNKLEPSESDYFTAIAVALRAGQFWKAESIFHTLLWELYDYKASQATYRRLMRAYAGAGYYKPALLLLPMMVMQDLVIDDATWDEAAEVVKRVVQLPKFDVKKDIGSTLHVLYCFLWQGGKHDELNVAESWVMKQERIHKYKLSLTQYFL